MPTRISQQIEALKHMTVRQLRERYQEVFGQESRSNHKQFLFRRIAWRLQAQAEGGLSDRARRRALEIADDNELRIRAPKGFDFDEAATRSADQTVAADPIRGGRCRAQSWSANTRAARSPSAFSRTTSNSTGSATDH